MGIINQWIDDKLGQIATKLPTLVHTDPASFACGYNMGYKTCLLDIERFFEDFTELPEEIKEGCFKNKWELNEQ